MQLSVTVAKILTFASVLIAGCVYVVFANSLSETDMVHLAYLWVPLAVTGIAVWATGHTNWRFAGTVALAAFAGLFFFFSVIFPML